MKKRNLLPLLAIGALVLTGCSSGKSQVEISRENGLEYMSDGRYEEAIKSFDNAYAWCDEKMPETKTDVALYKANCQWLMEDYDGLIETCDRILELKESGEACYFKGAAKLKQGLEDEAAAAFDLAAQYSRSDYQMLLNIYHLYEENSKSAVGDVYLQQALALPNETMNDYYQKGYIYYYLGEYQEALDELALPVENNEEDAMLLMGQAYLSLGDSVRARNIFQKYLKESQGSARAYNGLALCDLEDKAYDSALTNIGKGLESKPKKSVRKELLYNEIVAYEMKLDFETAKVKAESFVSSYPNDEDGKREYAFLSTR